MLKLTIGDKLYGMRKMPPTLGAFFAPKIAKVVAGMVGNDKFLEMLNNLKNNLSDANKDDINEAYALVSGSKLRNEQIIEDIKDIRLCWYLRFPLRDAWSSMWDE